MAKSEGKSAAEIVEGVGRSVESQFKAGRRVLSFAEYLDVFRKDPARHVRDAARYTRDVFDFYGHREVTYPWGTFRRFTLFDLPWEQRGKDSSPRGALVSQEWVQEEIYRALSNFAREGRPNRVILLHGPNGSAKSTIVGCIMRALEDYSHRDEGALYAYGWVFPSTDSTKGSLGFGGRAAENSDSYAHLPDHQIDAKVLIEVRDHPLFLVPVAEREALLGSMNLAEPVPEWVMRGQMSHKSRQIFEALLANYKGSYKDVLKHIQVERYFISQRYRVGAVTIGPQMSVDAGERQVTADRSMGSLPASLQALSLYEAKGELVDAAGGLLEFSDLLKRPLDAFKYLQLVVESNEVALTSQNLHLNCVMMGSANELHLDAFREHPEFQSFRGRLDLIRTPYIRSHAHERSIYDALVAPQVQKHVAPHATSMASTFAVLTRMRKPEVSKFGDELGKIVADLSVYEKLDLYAQGTVPARMELEAQKLLRARIAELYTESDAYPVYEGRIGASPREMRGVILDAAQSTKYACLNPLAVIEELDALCKRVAEFEWLQQEVKEGGYHDTSGFLTELFSRLLFEWEREMFAASGLVAETQYEELFEKYVQHVSVWTKKERVRNKLTGEFEEPDERMMKEVEELLEVKGDQEDARRQIISTIAAWAIDHPGDKVDTKMIFARQLAKMRDAIYSARLGPVAEIAGDVVKFVRDDAKGLEGGRKKRAEEVIGRLGKMFGYCPHCASDMAGMLLARRFSVLTH